jgi:hypothetical protein
MPSDDLPIKNKSQGRADFITPPYLPIGRHGEEFLFSVLVDVSL